MAAGDRSRSHSPRGEKEPWIGYVVKSTGEIATEDGVVIPAGTEGLVIANAPGGMWVAKFGGRDNFQGLARNVEVLPIMLAKWPFGTSQAPLVESVPPGQPLSYVAGSERMVKRKDAYYKVQPYVHQAFKAGDNAYHHFHGSGPVFPQATVLSDEVDGFVKVKAHDLELIVVADMWMPEEEKEKREKAHFMELDASKAWNEERQQWEEAYKIGERIKVMFGTSWQIGTVTSHNPLMVDSKKPMLTEAIPEPYAIGQHVYEMTTAKKGVIIEVLGDDLERQYKLKYDDGKETEFPTEHSYLEKLGPDGERIYGSHV